MQQDPIKHLWWSFCCKNSLLLSGVIFAKSFIIDVLKVPKYVSEYINPGDIDLFKVGNRSTRKRCEICSKLTTKIPEWCRSGVLIVNFERISYSFNVFIMDIEEVNVSLELTSFYCLYC